MDGVLTEILPYVGIPEMILDYLSPEEQLEKCTSKERLDYLERKYKKTVKTKTKEHWYGAEIEVTCTLYNGKLHTYNGQPAYTKTITSFTFPDNKQTIKYWCKFGEPYNIPDEHGDMLVSTISGVFESKFFLNNETGIASKLCKNEKLTGIIVPYEPRPTDDFAFPFVVPFVFLRKVFNDMPSHQIVYDENQPLERHYKLYLTWYNTDINGRLNPGRENNKAVEIEQEEGSSKYSYTWLVNDEVFYLEDHHELDTDMTLEKGMRINGENIDDDE
jgi:hypothetical protein